MSTVLVVGFTAEATDRTGLDIDLETLRRVIAAGDAEVEAAGYDVVRGWIGTDHTAGVPRFTELFEQLVNAVHELAPRARFAFNADPPSTLEALRRNS